MININMCKKINLSGRWYDSSIIYNCHCVRSDNLEPPRVIRNFDEAEIDLLLSPGKKIEYRRYITLLGTRTEKIIHCNACLTQEKFLNRNLDRCYQRF